VLGSDVYIEQMIGWHKMNCSKKKADTQERSL